MGIETNGVQLFGSPMNAREFRCTGSVNKWATATTGVLHKLQVPRTAYRRNIWLAFDALRSGTIANWYLSGRLVFWLNGARITEFQISKGYGVAPGMSMNIFAPSTGAGMQPALRATAWEDYALDYKSVDMPCFTFDVECDTITLEIDAMSIGGPYLTMTDIALASSGNIFTVSQAYLNLYYELRKNADASPWNTAIGYMGATGTNPTISNMTTALGMADATSKIVDIRSKTLVSLFNSSPYWTNLTSVPTIIFAEHSVAQDWSDLAHVQASFPHAVISTGYVIPTVIARWDGLANLMTGLIVASQYPGGL